MRKNILSIFSFILLFLLTPSSIIVYAQVTPAIPDDNARPQHFPPPLYPFPCDERSDKEFHSLRPYQGSPCNPNKEDLALFCGNDIYVGDYKTILKVSNEDTKTYLSGGSEVYPNLPVENLSPNLCAWCSSDYPAMCYENPNLPCIPELICGPPGGTDPVHCNTCEVIDGGAREKCAFTIGPITKNIRIDVSDAEFPIMGYTEPSYGNDDEEYKVINSINDTEETVDHATKMNEYVSWYLNGVTGRAEYSYLNPNLQCVGASTEKVGTCMETRVEADGTLTCLGTWGIPFAEPFEQVSLMADGKSVCTGEKNFCCVSKILPSHTDDTPGSGYIINYSGPIKKLLPFSIQNIERINEVNDATASVDLNAKIRHNQIIGCDTGSVFDIIFSIIGMEGVDIFKGAPTKCYGYDFLGIFDIDPFVRNLNRLKDFANHLPPIEDYFPYLGEDFYNVWLTTYKHWRGNTCIALPIWIPFGDGADFTYNLCFDNPAFPNIYGNLFSYVPFSSTEDRLGDIKIKKLGFSNTSYSGSVRILYSRFTVPPKNADMFVPHMVEDVELARILQNTYTFKDADQTSMGESTFTPNSPYCELVETRSNPGDDLFATELTATVEYTAQMTCTFLNWGGTLGAPVGNLCINQLGGSCIDLHSRDRWLWVKDNVSYGQYDCASGQLCIRGEYSQINQDYPCLNPAGPAIGCFPDNFVTDSGALCPPWDWVPLACPDHFVCAAMSDNCHRVNKEIPPQSCTYPVLINLKTETRTPLADEAWARLVAGSAGVFRKNFPKIGGDSSFEGILDMPGFTKVKYTDESPGGGIFYVGNPNSQTPGEKGLLYFPHIGGIREYFMKGIQTLLRPKGFGEQIVTSVPDGGGFDPGDGDGDGDCGYTEGKIDQAIENAANQYGIPASMLRGIFEIEALEFIHNPDGYICEKNFALAMGLSQVTDGAYNAVTCASERYDDDTGICTSDGGRLSRCDVNDSFELAARVLLWKAGCWSGCNQTCDFPGNAQDQYAPVCAYYGTCDPDYLTKAYSYNLPSGQCANQNYCDIVFNKMGRGNCQFLYGCPYH